MRLLTGKVVSGVGNFSYWIDKLKVHYQEKTGLTLFPGTLNVMLGEEYGGTVSINIVPCRIFEEEAVILRTETNERGEGLHPRTIVEVACEVKLRDKYNLKDGDMVQIRVETDARRAE